MRKNVSSWSRVLLRKTAGLPGWGRGWLSLPGAKEALRGTGESWHLDSGAGTR